MKQPKTNFIRLSIAALASGLGMWIIAGLWHNLVLPFFNESVHPHQGNLPIMLFGYFTLAFIMVYIYMHSFKKGKRLVAGLKLGVIVGVLWVFPHGLVMAGVHETSIIYEIKNAIWHMIEQGIGGIIIALIIGRK
jgi:hypothetical protein